eukprot:g7752.t1
MRVLARLGYGYASAYGFPFLWLWAAISSPLLGPPSAQQGAFAVVIYDANAVREALTGLRQAEAPRTAQSPVAQLREEGDAENSTLLEIVDAEERKQYVLSTLFQEPAYRYSIAPEDPTLMQRVLHLFLPDNVQEVILGDFVASDKADPYGGAESEAMRAAFTELLGEVGKWHRFGLEKSCAKKQQKFVADLWGRNNYTTGTGGAAGPPLLPLHLRDAHMKGTKTKTRSYSTPAQMNVWRFGPRGVYFPVVAVVPRIKYNGAEPPSAPQTHTQHLTAPRSTTLSSSIDYRCFGPDWQDKVVVAEPDFETCHAFDWNGDNDPRALFCCAEEASAGLDIWADSAFFDPQEAGTRTTGNGINLGPLAALTLIGSQLQEAATTARGNESGSVRRANMFDPSLRPFPGIYYHAAARSQTPERRAPPAGPGRHTSSSAPRAQTGERPEDVSSRAAATSSSRKSRSRTPVEMNEEEERPISGTRMRWQDVVHYIGKKLQFPALPPKTKLKLASRVEEVFPFQSYHPQHREGCPVPRFFPTALTVQVPYQS